MFTITHQHLLKLCEVNSFPTPAEGMIFFGVRGCLPVDVFNHDFLTQQSLNVTPVDYTSPRCTLGQWLPADQTLAVFPGSTSPHNRYTSAIRKRTIHATTPNTTKRHESIKLWE